MKTLQEDGQKDGHHLLRDDVAHHGGLELIALVLGLVDGLDGVLESEITAELGDNCPVIVAREESGWRAAGGVSSGVSTCALTCAVTCAVRGNARAEATQEQLQHSNTCRCGFRMMCARYPTMFAC